MFSPGAIRDEFSLNKKKQRKLYWQNVCQNIFTKDKRQLVNLLTILIGFLEASSNFEKVSQLIVKTNGN